MFKKYRDQDDQSDIFGQEVAAYIENLHHKSQQQWIGLSPLIIRYAFSRILGRRLTFNSSRLKKYGLAIDPAQGRFLYAMVLAKQPKVIVEYGTSFGISTLYLAQALKFIGQGQIFGAELESLKTDQALKNLQACALDHLVEIRLGDVLQTFKDFQHKIDMIFMDGFPALNLDVLNRLEPYMNPGCLIVTDDAILFGFEMKEYLTYLKHSDYYSHQVIPLSDGMGVSILKTPIKY